MDTLTTIFAINREWLRVSSKVFFIYFKLKLCGGVYQGEYDSGTTIWKIFVTVDTVALIPVGILR